MLAAVLIAHSFGVREAVADFEHYVNLPILPYATGEGQIFLAGNQ